MIIRQFINWVRTAPAGERAEATRALCRAWLISDLTDDDRMAAEGAMLMLLDDASPLVREAMAQVFAGEASAPRAIVASLASDQPSVAMPVLEFSPLLMDADLVDLVATGTCETQRAIARRFELPSPVCAAIAEVGSAAAALELIENPDADLASFSIDRIVERHGHLAAIREVLLQREDLSASTRHALVSRLSDTLARFVTSRDWMSPTQAARTAEDALARSTVNIAASSQGEEMTRLVRHLRANGQLNAGLILRALLSGNQDLFEYALVELSGLPRERVAALVYDRGAASLHALLGKAGLPESTFLAFRAALETGHDLGFAGAVAGAAHLRRQMVERVLTRCENESAAEPLLIMLRRFAIEAAREEARVFCDELAAEFDLLPRVAEILSLDYAEINAQYEAAESSAAVDDLGFDLEAAIAEAYRLQHGPADNDDFTLEDRFPACADAGAYDEPARDPVIFALDRRDRRVAA
ncbi:MAG: DUF2336 domain-containing protein [Bradyrhizobiaceae bacterium]|nr:MAG: DUF2336 domain-containing protein [Bradyrhizobiaceae bacterium]